MSVELTSHLQDGCLPGKRARPRQQRSKWTECSHQGKYSEPTLHLLPVLHHTIVATMCTTARHSLFYHSQPYILSTHSTSFIVQYTQSYIVHNSKPFILPILPQSALHPTLRTTVSPTLCTKTSLTSYIVHQNQPYFLPCAPQPALHPTLCTKARPTS